jgi:hypothetical protein
MNEEEFQAWKHSPATGPFLAHLHRVRERIKEDWGSGSPVDEVAHAIAIVYGDILDLDYERDVRPHYERSDNEQE